MSIKKLVERLKKNRARRQNRKRAKKELASETQLISVGFNMGKAAASKLMKSHDNLWTEAIRNIPTPYPNAFEDYKKGMRQDILEEVASLPWLSGEQAESIRTLFDPAVDAGAQRRCRH